MSRSIRGDSSYHDQVINNPVSPRTIICPSSNAAIIAHSKEGHQVIFDKRRLATGVQWEIARLVTTEKIQYREINLEALSTLYGSSNLGAGKVENLLCSDWDANQPQESGAALIRDLSKNSPWAELDKEEQRLREDPMSGLGCHTLHDDWYGGKIAFTLRLHQKDPKEPVYTLEVCPPELGTSTRMARRWGSWRILRVRIPEEIPKHANNRLTELFKRDFVLHGRVFKPFYAKEHNIFMVQINRAYKDGNISRDDSVGGVPFEAFLEWHNPMDYNVDQSLAKWCARMALALSNSAPGLMLDRYNILEIPDIYSTPVRFAMAQNPMFKPESKDIMTDGAGFCSQTLLMYLKHKFKWENVPCAIQFRLFGAKGLLILHPEDSGLNTEPQRVWLRPSQTKTKYDETQPIDPAHLVLDVLRRSQVKTPARLSSEIIVNLSENKVPYEVFLALMKTGLQEIAASLTQWDGQFAMQNLWSVISKVNGSVTRARMAKEAGGLSRLMGLSVKDWDDYQDDDVPEIDKKDEEDNATFDRFQMGSDDKHSTAPATLEEYAMALLDAGFQPPSCPILASKLKEIEKKAFSSYINGYKIVVKRSAEAWIIPDPVGVLAPGEIFFKTSEQTIGPDDVRSDHLSCDVLVTRHPCRVPSDIQKVRAVWKDELRKYCDVIIFSTQGDRSLASMLGGGDYDGDTGHIIWEPTIVDAFVPPNPKFADPPPSVAKAFQKDTLTVKEYLAGKRNKDGSEVDLSEYLLAALKDVSLVGQYSNFHDVATYRFGYESDEAWRLAYMFCEVLDSSKTGKIIDRDMLQADRRKYNVGQLEWKATLVKQVSGLEPPDMAPPKREGAVREVKFIMDRLRKDGEIAYDELMRNSEKFLQESVLKFKRSQGITTSTPYIDPALEAPWLEAQKHAAALKTLGEPRASLELNWIKDHVDRVYEDFKKWKKKFVTEPSFTSPSKKTSRKDKTASSDKAARRARDSIMQKLALEFSSMPAGKEFLTCRELELRLLRASYAYIHETSEEHKRIATFVFDVAMRDITTIKVMSLSSSYKMVTGPFYSTMNVVGAIQAFRHQGGEAYRYNVTPSIS